MGSHEIIYTLPKGDRALKRKELISKMLEEECGTGTGDNCSRYTYYVETYGEYGIYLKRPTHRRRAVQPGDRRGRLPHLPGPLPRCTRFRRI